MNFLQAPVTPILGNLTKDMIALSHFLQPNCYSRVITVNGDEHIIIFAKRDINQWEELTYDYRL